MKTSSHSQQGVFLIEALIGILIFSLGVLAMVALGTTAVSAQSDAQYRTEAANLANEIASEISLRADRVQRPNKTHYDADLTKQAMLVSITPFQLNFDPSDNAPCQFKPVLPVDAAALALVNAWVTKVTGTLPGVPGGAHSGLQIDTSTLAAFNGVRVTLCWKAPTDQTDQVVRSRSYTLVTYIN